MTKYGTKCNDEIFIMAHDLRDFSTSWQGGYVKAAHMAHRRQREEVQKYPGPRYSPQENPCDLLPPNMTHHLPLTILGTN